MLPRIIGALRFRSNNRVHRPILDALAIIERHRNCRAQYYQADEVPIDGVIRAKWRDIVIEAQPDAEPRINRINYEICVLHLQRWQR